VTPRQYHLQKRAESTAATRQRVLDATIEVYREVGIPATTLKAVAERADVSRGTILHHFGSGEGLLGAVLDTILESLELPDLAAIEALDTLDARVRLFVGGMIEFQDRTAHLWPIFEKELQRPQVAQREAAYWAALAKLQAATLGPGLRDDPAANAALLSVIHPATVGTFQWAFGEAGLARADGGALLLEVAVDAVRRVADRSKRGKGGHQ
jgi:AcrR family transcriptional regulator